jgi:hypothetical protein
MRNALNGCSLLADANLDRGELGLDRCVWGVGARSVLSR